MGRVFRGAAVRTLFCMCIALITILVVVLYEGKLTGSGSWACSMGIAFLIIEGIVTNKMTQGFDWKWFNPASIIFAGNCLAAIWFLQLRTLSFHSQGLEACTNTTAAQELTKIDLTLAADWLNFCACGHCNGAAEQFFVTILLVGRYFLPRGARFYHPENDKINLFLKSIARTHFFLVITCNGADALDLLSYTRFPTVQGNAQLVSMLLILFSISIGQFCIDTLGTAEKKVSDVHIIVETDLWASLLIILCDDIPFLAMRLFVMTNYQVFSAMGVFFFFKNFVSICVTLHKGVMIWLGKDEDEIEEYVASQPWSPEPLDRDSIMDTPDSLDSISQAASIYSNENAVKSRVEKQHPKTEWGNEDTWFGKSQSQLERENTSGTIESSQNGVSQSQDWDVEAGPKDLDRNPLASQQLEIWNPEADPAYFTEGYALECDALVEVSRIGHSRYISAPLGPALMRGQIDYRQALPKPQPPRIDSAHSDKIEKKKRENTQDLPEEPDSEKEKKSKPKSDKLEEDIEDILSAVDEEPKKEKKKKKKKDREKDKEKTEDGADEEKREEKKHKKKKSKSEERDLDEEPERAEKHKKKKKNKNKDKDKDHD
ncbi:uncharacterized protein [Watersipora subatra]|uniref:uncharacterized protein n=1 Tax=Watersipora subatra TaxID=2589382 RepID=UPI00355BD40F